MMQEDFLYYIWKMQYFDKQDLTTCQGASLQVVHPGTRNEHAGPDFLSAKIMLDGVAWHGHVEMHLRASDWYAHQHHKDKAYDNVILHVVWDPNQDIQQPDGTVMPMLALKDRVAPDLFQQYQKLVQTQTPIPCARQLPQVPELVRTSMLDKALFQRLTHKNNLVYQLLENNQGNWEETAYQLLAYNFGFKVNSAACLDLALSLPFKHVVQHADQLMQVEALLLGQAGLLTAAATSPPDDYLAALQKEYRYLAHKYQLRTGSIQASQWKFFRLRPANFPTLRLAQLAQLLHCFPQVFDLLANTPTQMLYKKLAVTPSTYWQRHYRFAQQSAKPIPGLGKESIERILTNAVVPLLVAYGKTKDEQDYVDRAVAILQHLPAEHNKITRQWTALGIPVKSAFDSQALIELFNNFCTHKKCLSCHIGVDIIQQSAGKQSAG